MLESLASNNGGRARNQGNVAVVLKKQHCDHVLFPSS